MLKSQNNGYFDDYNSIDYKEKFQILLLKYYLGIQTSQSSSSNEPKSRTLPLRSSSLVEPQVSSSSSQQPPAGKKKSGGFFSMKRK
ncbi:unnamed protein product [Rotaria socialis]|uniref:Uncharacterized protein n=1 Tax=Rotaria socialis TaxID=392032 RepID=A0A821EIN9_9BILA|nr:unnamed protein product [Rotaria socialis]